MIFHVLNDMKTMTYNLYVPSILLLRHIYWKYYDIFSHWWPNLGGGWPKMGGYYLFHINDL